MANIPDWTNTEGEAVRYANLYPHSAWVARPNPNGTEGTPKAVTNLGWLLKRSYGHYGDVPLVFRIYKPIISNNGAAVMAAVFEDGTVYATIWQSKSVLSDWLDRPTFREVPIDWRIPALLDNELL